MAGKCSRLEMILQVLRVLVGDLWGEGKVEWVVFSARAYILFDFVSLERLSSRDMV